MNININLSQEIENTSLGKLGEHNATTLVVTDDMPAENITHYRLAFQTGGQSVLSEAFNELPISYPLPRALTSYPRISMQLIGYDDDGNLVRKSDKIAKFYFEPSIPNTEIEVDGANHDLAFEIVTIKGEIEAIDAKIDTKADKGTSYTKDEENALLYLKASREWVQAQGYANTDDLEAKQNKLTPGEGISIDGDTISATGGAGGKEPFFAKYNETAYEDVKQAIIDGRQVFLNYDTGNTSTKYVALNYIGHNKGTEPYDVSADISGYIFRFSGLGGSITNEGGKYTAYYARLNSNGAYNSHSDEIVSGHGVVDYDPAGEYRDTDIMTAYGVLDAIEDALANIPSAEGGSY